MNYDGFSRLCLYREIPKALRLNRGRRINMPSVLQGAGAVHCQIKG